MQSNQVSIVCSERQQAIPRSFPRVPPAFILAKKIIASHTDGSPRKTLFSQN